MIFHALTASFVCFLLLQPSDPVELIPVDAGVEDRGALSDSLHVERSDMRQDQAFEKLYRIAGSDNVYVRKSGGLSAVFSTSAYVRTPNGDVPIVPAGTVYYIGEIPPELIQQLGVLQEPVEIPDPPTMIITTMATQQKSITLLKEPTPHHSIKFLDNETYRRQRLASFVLDIVLLD
jgi:hypothetical protein